MIEVIKAIEEKATGAGLSGLLAGMSLGFNLNPVLRRNFYSREDGKYKPFDARFQFRDENGKIELFIDITDGKMKAGAGKVSRPHLTATLRDAGIFRRFFSPTNPADPLNLMLDNDLTLSGNLSYIARLGHLMEAFRREYSGVREKKEKSGGAGAIKAGMEALNSSRAERDIKRIKCEKTPECMFLDDPFLSSRSLKDFPRIAEMRAEFFGGRGEICTERPRLITEYCRRHGFEKDPQGRVLDPVLRQAEALRYLMENKAAIIRDRNLLAGTTTTKMPGVIVFPELAATGIWPELLTMRTRVMNPYRISPADADILNMEIFPYWSERNVREWTRTNFGSPRCQELDERWVLYFMWKTAALSHTIPDYPAVLSRGLIDIKGEVEEKLGACTEEKSANFYKASMAVIDGVINYAGRLSRKAGEMAARLELRGTEMRSRVRELRDMERICRKVPAKPAETLHEALQSIWILKIALHMENMNAGLSFGRFDVWLQPYFKKEISEISSHRKREEYVNRAIELTASFFLQCNDHLPLVPDVGNRLFGGSSSDMALTVGGVDREGKSAVCDMTYVILKVAEMLTLRDPNLNARYYPGVNSIEYLRRLCEVNVITGSTPSIHNDKAVVETLINQGFAQEDARDWGATGCVEPTSCGRHIGHTNCMLLNTVAALEMALNNGLHPLLREQVGPRTGEMDSFVKYENFLNAYKEQLKYLIHQSIDYNNYLGHAHQYVHPTPLLSSLVQGCIDKGRDVTEGGARYNSSGAALVSLVDVVDSLMGIKKAVFEEKIVSFNDLKKALEADFKGYEPLHAKLAGKMPKFGSGAEEPEKLARELVDYIYREYQSRKNYRGGRYTSGFWSMSNHVAFGTLSGALPSGRKRGKAFTPGITPSASASTSLMDNMRAVASLDSLKMPNNIAFNVKLSPSPGEPHQVFVDHATAYAKTYFETGGMQIQFNMVTSQMLKDAMEHPENYRNLMVRISGYNAYFVELSRDMQIELIERAEYR